MERYWTFEKCQTEAKTYSTRGEYRKNCPSYQAASKYGWLDEICSHMGKPIQTKYVVYSYEFQDNHVYVGLTKNKSKRFNEHLSNHKSPVYKHILETQLFPKLSILYEQLVYNDDEIKKQECFWLEKYVSNGWVKLNRMKTGGLGGSTLIWTKKKCHRVALTCENRSEFFYKFNGAYDAARKNGWLDEICSHMEILCKPNGYWTYDRCREVALRCKSVKEFSEKYPSVYTLSKNHKWMCEFNLFLINKKINHKKPNYWTKENCRVEALKFNSRFNFQNLSHGAYNAAFKNRWLDEICSHMEFLCRPKGYWDNYENCKQEALKYTSRTDFYHHKSGAYNAARENGWLNEFFRKKNGKI